MKIAFIQCGPSPGAGCRYYAERASAKKMDKLVRKVGGIATPVHPRSHVAFMVGTERSHLLCLDVALA